MVSVVVSIHYPWSRIRCSRAARDLLSSAVDWLVTVDPHLHRRASLQEIYSVPASVVPGAPAISEWIRSEVQRPVLVGPDAGSLRWVRAVAEGAGAPFTVLEKIRRGDREVEVSVPEADRWRDHTPVLVDDIISTARTMLATMDHLKLASLPPPDRRPVQVPTWNGDCILDGMTPRVELIRTVPRAGAP